MTKLCKDCKFFSGYNFCKHPMNGEDLVNGGFKTIFASTMRTDHFSWYCKEEGVYWIQKETKKSFWRNKS